MQNLSGSWREYHYQREIIGVAHAKSVLSRNSCRHYIADSELYEIREQRHSFWGMQDPSLVAILIYELYGKHGVEHSYFSYYL